MFHKYFSFKIHNQKGQVLAEILVAVVLAGIIIGGITISTGTSVATNTKIRETTNATNIVQDLIEKVKIISEQNWLKIYCPPSGTCPGSKGSSNLYYVDDSFQIQNGTTSQLIDGINYISYFYIDNVNRDSSGNIVSTGGTEDPSTQKITVVASWGNSSISMSEYLMRLTSQSISDFNWRIELVSSGIFTASLGYYAATSGTMLFQNGAISLTPTNSGSFTSVIFDTQQSKGVAFNSIRWKGSLPTSSHVRLQFASSNSTSSLNFIGPDGTSATYYEAAGPDVVIPLSLIYHNNHRYFQYKVYLDPTTDYSAAPTIYKIIVNYSY